METKAAKRTTMSKSMAPRAAVCLLVAACGGGGGSPGTPPPTAADTTAPVVALSAPADLSSGLTGTIAVSASAADDVGVQSVEFQLDGEQIALVTSGTYQASVVTGDHASGQHVLRVRARDAAGNVSGWQSATVEFGGSTDVAAGFTKDEIWAGGMGASTAFAQAPDGRLFVCEQGGKLRVVKNGVLQAAPFHTFAVDPNGERGLLGVAFHPDFASNAQVYVYYTATAAGAHNRISRLTASAANPDVSTGVESVLVDLPNLSSATNHNGGAIHFGGDGKLYAGVGENANPAKAQDLNDVFGKMLRFNDDGSIPSDGAFCSTPNVQKCAIWAYGLRNPFTFAVEPGSGRIHVNDVGQNTWEEINLGGAGLNHGWPGSEGPDNVSGLVSGPLFSYKHGDASPPGSGPGGFFTGIAIAGGSFYPAGGSFPASHHGNYFFADFGAGWVGRLDPANGLAAYAFANIAGNPVDMLVGIDGALYVLAQQGSITRISAP
jgi:glucose/arabinose dehydrogenase